MKEAIFEEKSHNDSILTIYYSDYTYRCIHWQEGMYSDWCIIDGWFHFKHEGDAKFHRVMESNDTQKVVNALDKAITDFLFEKEVLIG
jgi:hypothetical protein